MNLQEFIKQYQGKQVNSRGGILGECVALAQRWAEVNGVSGSPVFPVAAAKDMAGSRPDAFTWIANTPTGVPQPGDIIVMNGRVGGGYGHTGIVTAANQNTFNIFDQWNIGGGATAGIRTYGYGSVSGWLRLKNKASNNQGGNMAQVSEQQIYAWLHGPGGIDDLTVQNYNLGLKIKEKDAALANYDIQFKTQADKIEELAVKVDKLQKENDVLKTQGGYPKTLGGVFEAFMGVLKDFWKK